MRYLRLTLLVASIWGLAMPAAAQTTEPSSTPTTSTTVAPGTGPDRTRQQLCDGQPCEDPDQARDMQRLHSQDMDWLDNYGPAAGGGPGNAQRRGPHSTSGAGPRGAGGAGGAGHQGPGPH